MDLIQEHLIELLMTVLTVLIGVVCTSVKKYLNAKFNEKQLEQGMKYANIAIHAIEQVYIEADGQEKFNKAKHKFIQMLNENKIKINEKQIDDILEAMVNEMNKSLKSK